MDPTILHPADCRTCGVTVRDAETMTDDECAVCTAESDAKAFEETMSDLTYAAGQVGRLERVRPEQVGRLKQQLERLQRAVAKMETGR